MKLEIENNFQFKYMRQSFTEPSTLANKNDVMAWRTKWTDELKSWHSPYKVLVDCTNLTIDDIPEIRDNLARMMKFFEGFHLRKAAGFGLSESQNHKLLPFEVVATEEEAAKILGIRTPAQKSTPGDFRSSIQIQNDFRQHTVELNFSAPAVLDSKAKLNDLRSKLTNNLMQWHSKWNLVIDCVELEVNPSIHDDFKEMVKFLQGLFMKKVVGYNARHPKETYPFEVFRARHNAVTKLEAEGALAGNDANCNSRKA